MKKTLKTILTFGVGVVMLSACSFTKPYAVTNNTVNAKKGISTTKVIFGLGGVGSNNPFHPVSSAGIRFNKNYGIQEAAKNGGITKVGSVDLKYTNYILFGVYELQVTGE
jgi:hypothetical protein